VVRPHEAAGRGLELVGRRLYRETAQHGQWLRSYATAEAALRSTGGLLRAGAAAGLVLLVIHGLERSAWSHGRAQANLVSAEAKALHRRPSYPMRIVGSVAEALGHATLALDAPAELARATLPRLDRRSG